MPLDLILSLLNPVNILKCYLFKFILILCFHICLGLTSGLFPLGFLTKILYTFVISPYILHFLSILSSLI